MASTSPALLRVGQSGLLSGRRYNIVGWMLMSMDEGGVTYTWHEYHLIGPDGTSATLVQEEGEHGPEWRLFRLVEPAPMSAAEAATKRVGDSVSIAGESLRVTCVDESRVVRAEGQLPEGVEEGDVARYFNAESGNQMFVVSWTGDEVEVFRGLQLPGHAVYRAFGITPPPARMPSPSVEIAKPGGCVLTAFIAFAILGFVIFVAPRIFRSGFRDFVNPTSQPTTPTAPKPALAVGATGTIDGTRYRVAGRSQVEIVLVGRRYAGHEYLLVDDTGASVLLAQGTVKSGGEWLWLRPITTEAPLTPRQAATNALGSVLTIGPEPLQVTAHFLTRVRGVEGTPPTPPSPPLYGLAARGATQRALIRWDETNLTAYLVSTASQEQIKAFATSR